MNELIVHKYRDKNMPFIYFTLREEMHEKKLLIKWTKNNDTCCLYTHKHIILNVNTKSWINSLNCNFGLNLLSLKNNICKLLGRKCHLHFQTFVALQIMKLIQKNAFNCTQCDTLNILFGLTLSVFFVAWRSQFQ